MRLRIRMTALLCAVLLLFLNGCAPALQKSQMAPSWLALESVEKERAVRTPAPREDGTPYRVLMWQFRSTPPCLSPIAICVD